MNKKGISLITLILLVGFIVFFIGVATYSVYNINNTKLSNDRANLIRAYNMIIMDDLMNETINNDNKKELSIATLAKKVGRPEKELSENFKIDENGNLLEKRKVKQNKYIWTVIAVKPNENEE